jgi:D-alanine transaminase
VTRRSRDFDSSGERLIFWSNILSYQQPRQRDKFMNSLPRLPCYLNGDFTELPDAKISVMDRGFIFGDGVYEVVPVYAGRLFRFDQHMARLNRSLAEVRMANPLTLDQWGDVAHQLVNAYAAHIGDKVENINQLIYIQITRGVAMRDHVMPLNITPTVFAMANRMNLATDTQRSRGVACVTSDDFRWDKAHIKSTSLLGAVLARQISFDAGALETIMFRDGFLSEAAASNVWVVKDGRVIGTPKDNLVLEGIRYDLLEEICSSRGIGFELRRISFDEVLNADELLLTSATKEVLAVTTLNQAPVGSGSPGPVYAQLYQGYQAVKNR